jgi:hypothetical protein
LFVLAMVLVASGKTDAVISLLVEYLRRLPM